MQFPLTAQRQPELCAASTCDSLLGGKKSEDGGDSSGDGNGGGVGFVVENAPQQVVDMEYAVRGEVFIRALEIEKNIHNYKGKFDQILRCHIGNPHIVGMKPLSYLREVISLSSNHSLLNRSDAELKSMGFSSDGIERARLYFKILKEPGSYTHSQGALGLREIIAEFFARRDGYPVEDLSSIFLSNGASDIINTILTACIRDSNDAVLLPHPQYPLYSAVITKLGGTCVYYSLDEEAEWNLDRTSLDEAYQDAIDQQLRVRAVVIISPGNPAPTLLDENQIKQVLQFADEKNILCIADEVYQDNVYTDERKFISFRKVLLNEQKRQNDETAALRLSEAHQINMKSIPMNTSTPPLATQLASIHSCSKGFYGECGFRGGLALFDNVEKSMLKLLYKMRSVELCSNTIGQIVLTAVLSPPTQGQESFPLYITERDAILGELKEKAIYTWKFLNSIEGIECQPINGALYAFPRIRFSPAAIRAAKEKNKSVELMYCLELLEATGMVTTPGDGFGKRKDSPLIGKQYHMRFTILPPKDRLISALDKFKKFHLDFTARYS